MTTNAFFSNSTNLLQKEICLVDRLWSQTFTVDVSCSGFSTTSVPATETWETTSVTERTINIPSLGLAITAELLPGANFVGTFGSVVGGHQMVDYAGATNNQRSRVKITFSQPVSGFTLSFSDLDISPDVFERVINSTIGLPSAVSGPSNNPSTNVAVSPTAEDATVTATWNNLDSVTEFEFEVLFNGSNAPWTDQWGLNIVNVVTCLSVVDVMTLIRGTTWDGVQEFFYPPQEYLITDNNEVNQWVSWFNGLGIGTAMVINNQPNEKKIMIVNSPLKLDSLYHSPSGSYTPGVVSGFNNLGENYSVIEESRKIFNVTAYDDELNIIASKYFDQWNSDVTVTQYQELIVCEEMAETNILLQQLVNCICCDDYSYLSGLAIGEEWL